MGTGIVFVVLVAIWVAYFVQYWSRRREHLATARSVESFAEAMRVLERRPALPSRTGYATSSAYAMSPARVVSARPAPRPQVIAKPHPLTSRSHRPSADPASPSMMPSPSRAGAPRMSTPATPRPATAAVTPARTTPSTRRPSVAMSPSRKVRGLTLLGSIAATAVLAVLAAFVLVHWWAVLVGVAAVGAGFFWLRSGVQGEIAARRAARGAGAARSGKRPGSRVPPRASRAERARKAVPSVEEHEVSTTTGRGAERELIDTGEVTVAADSDGHSDGDTPADSDPAAAPHGWQPVPVPPPTYTLKAKAERPAPAAAEADAPAHQQTTPAMTAASAAASAVPVAVSAADSLAASHGEREAEGSAAYGT